MSFKDQLTADLDAVFFNTEEFADGATLTTGSGASAITTSISVFIDKGYRETQGVENYSISALCKTSDVTAVRPGDTVALAGITYKVLGPPEHSSDGTSTLYLTED
jgi:hypothetical protein